jgi:hypothetical protein
VPFIV